MVKKCIIIEMGALESEVTYHYGYPITTEMTYHNDGRKASEITFLGYDQPVSVEDLRESPSCYCDYYIKYFQINDDNIHSEGRIVEGDKVGKWIFYDKTGNIKKTKIYD